MSGGYFDYSQFSFDDAAERIEDYLLKCVKNGDNLPKEVESRLILAAKTARLAGKMIHRVDWFVSCDDGEDSFIKRWNEEIAAEAIDPKFNSPAFSKDKGSALVELVDGAYDLIEIWPASSPAQVEWKKRWLAKAKECGANPSW